MSHPTGQRNRLATVALVLGIVSGALSLLPYLVVLTFFPGLIAIILGIISGMPSKPHRRRGIAGAIIAPLGGVLGIIITIIVASSNPGTSTAPAPTTAPTAVNTPSLTIPSTTAPAPTVTFTPPAAPTITPTPVTPPQPTTDPKPAPGTTSAVTLLNRLTVRADVTSGYRRTLFVHWIDANGNGLTTRDEILTRQSKTGAITGGSWTSAYDGITTTDPGSLDIDHLVPLAEAWRSGANAWTPQKRRAYANDLGYPNALIAVTARQNRSKGDKDPANYLPPRTAYVCTYIKTWIAVKSRWQLSIDTAEKQALTQNLRGCDPYIATPGTPNLAVLAGSGSSADDMGGNDTGSTGNGNPGSTGMTSSTPPKNGTGTKQATDPQYGTCTELKRHPNHAPYTKGVDPEYAWYMDRDHDGSVCE